MPQAPLGAEALLAAYWQPTGSLLASPQLFLPSSCSSRRRVKRLRQIRWKSNSQLCAVHHSTLYYCTLHTTALHTLHHCTGNCTLHCAVHCTLYNTLLLYTALHCTLHCAVHCTGLHTTPRSNCLPARFGQLSLGFPTL